MAAVSTGNPIVGRRKSVQRGSHQQWTDDQDKLLWDLKAQSKNWEYISAAFQGKSANACRKRHERLRHQHNRAEYQHGRRMRYMIFKYVHWRQRLWEDFAEEFKGMTWQDVEKQIFRYGLTTIITEYRKLVREGYKLASSDNLETDDDDFEEMEEDQEEILGSEKSYPLSVSPRPESDIDVMQDVIISEPTPEQSPKQSITVPVVADERISIKALSESTTPSKAKLEARTPRGSVSPDPSTKGSESSFTSSSPLPRQHNPIERGATIHGQRNDDMIADNPRVSPTPSLMEPRVHLSGPSNSYPSIRHPHVQSGHNSQSSSQD